jgi:hypothetical protein
LKVPRSCVLVVCRGLDGVNRDLSGIEVASSCWVFFATLGMGEGTVEGCHRVWEDFSES